MKTAEKFIRNTKKAFTLVELVVVIAILAILAAIAIPAVIGIIGSASESQIENDAASIDSAVKTFHAGLTTGTITAKNIPHTVSAAAMAFPLENASNGTRASFANEIANVRQAMQYAGIWESLKSAYGSKEFGYAEGSVVAAMDGDGNVISQTAGGTTITVLSTGSETLGVVLGNVKAAS